MRPLLLLDVDGPLHPWAATAQGRPPGFVEHRYRLSRWRRATASVWLNPAHGAALLALADVTGAELVWATSWGDRANVVIGPAIGLPRLPVIDFAGSLADSGPDWKFRAVARHCYGRPLAWLDDDFELRPQAREAFLIKRKFNAAPTLLASVDPRTGLTDADLDAVLAWLQALSAGQKPDSDQGLCP
ncbi:HAD domain-containing protein [Labedaea rhizosphaerae]|uniref:HAD domain-containing protein n=1 Tax=Labedaea rhizosphaerae TaxID=598644 RepID=UPI001414E9F3|nr:HAD domain-containing protein [Labedaea rhizosphaerae]